MKRKWILLFRWAGIILLILLLLNFRLVTYGIEQLIGQLQIVWKAVPIEQALEDHQLPDSLKKKLLLVQEIRQFAFDSIGLKPTDSYTTFYNQQGKPVLWNVTGCQPFKLEAYHWWFPFLGQVSYKGFFNEANAGKEYELLKSKGYDADVSPVGGWSTLGWFTDPVLSNMLRRHEGMLAELIIHELTHATVYLKSSVELNENLATFTGEQGAIWFLKSRYGENSQPLTKYLQYKSDEDTYGRYIMKGAERLDSLYSSAGFMQLPLAEKYLLKYRTIASILQGVENLNLYKKRLYIHDFRNDPLPDNTYFMSYLRYRKKQDLFSEEWRNTFNGDLKQFIQSYASQ